MNEKTYVLILALIFVLHNIEEYASYDQIPSAYFKLIGNKFKNSRTFLYAIAILSIVVIFITLLNYFFSNKILETSIIILVFSILINALQHVIGSIWYRRFLPGTFTGIFFIIPFSIVYLIKFDANMKMDFYNLLLYISLSIIVMFLSIYFSLRLGYFLMKLTHKK
ncbi:MAG: HXXEE domain-containing protein [Chlamydiae bacterium]|nr:HXXEE domain-containing protein [Chlamydiota bacterium]